MFSQVFVSYTLAENKGKMFAELVGKIARQDTALADPGVLA